MPRNDPRALPDEAAIRTLAGPTVFERGHAYRSDGAVSRLVARGDPPSAAAAGSDVEPYRVTVRLAAGRIEAADCTCPYAWGGACKHGVAALPGCVHSRRGPRRPAPTSPTGSAAPRAYDAAGRSADWTRRIEGLITTHKRKH